MYTPTKEQTDKITELQAQGYKYNESLTISFSAVILNKGEDLCIFGLDGTIDLHRNINEFKRIKVN